MKKKWTISVVMPAHNEEKSIYQAVKDFYKPEVDEVIVVDNCCTDRTAEFAKKAGAKVVEEKKKGYGYALQKGMRAAKGEVIILTESDATFVGDDIYKLLAYIDDVDFVLGTRTTMELVEEGAKMGLFLFLGNVFIAKLIQLKYWRKTRLTDVGCTLRAIKRKPLMKIINKFKVGDSHFSPEMIVEALNAGIRTVEIPVRYRTRIGESKITSNKWKSFKLGLKMIALVLFDMR